MEDEGADQENGGEPGGITQRTGETTQEFEEDAEDEPQNDFNLNQITTLNVFLPDRNPRELNI